MDEAEELFPEQLKEGLKLRDGIRDENTDKKLVRDFVAEILGRISTSNSWFFRIICKFLNFLLNIKNKWYIS